MRLGGFPIDSERAGQGQDRFGACGERVVIERCGCRRRRPTPLLHTLELQPEEAVGGQGHHQRHASLRTALAQFFEASEEPAVGLVEETDLLLDARARRRQPHPQLAVVGPKGAQGVEENRPGIVQATRGRQPDAAAMTRSMRSSRDACSGSRRNAAWNQWAALAGAFCAVV